MVVAVSSLILSPKSLRKSHGYLVGSPWQWRKQTFQTSVLSISFSGMNCLLATVWLGWLIPCAGELGLSKLQADEVKRLRQRHSSAAEKMNENSSMLPCQPECSLRKTQSFGFFSSSGCCRPNSFH